VCGRKAVVLGFFLRHFGIHLVTVGVTVRQPGMALRQAQVPTLMGDFVRDMAHLAPAGNAEDRDRGSRDPRATAANARRLRNERSDIG